MRSQWKRLMWAALLSCTGFGATFTWYYLSKSKTHTDQNEKPLAFVGKVVDEIQRRPATRLSWQEVGTGEPLFNGEAIRTSEKGEVRIQFAESDRYLDLEPESLIVIQQSKGEIALDLMEGSLFVAAAKEGEAAGTSLVLNSASGKVDLSRASANLSKTAGSQVDVQVLEGSASIKGKDGKEKVLGSGAVGGPGQNNLSFNKADLQILSPVSGKVQYVDPDEKDGLTFKWKGFPAKLKVSIFTGPTRKDLKESTHMTALSADSLKASLPMGKPYWKLVAKDPVTQKVMAESSIYRAEVQARYAPTVVFPVAGAKIPAPKSPFDMTFKWQKGDETTSVVLEVAKDPGLKQKIATKNFTEEDSFTLPALTEGDYYWRMSSYYEGSEKPVLGKIQKFSVSMKPEEKVIPKDPVQISWTVPEDKIQFYLDNPKLGLTWTGTRSEDISLWRLKYYEENEDPRLAKVIEVKESKSDTIVQKPGRYIASLEAVDKQGQVIGTSQNRKIAVAPLPPLPSPKLLPLEGILTAAADGRTELNWEKIEGAKEYSLTISNKNGKELKTLKYTQNKTSLKNLMPGEYLVKLTTIDQHGRISEAGVPRKLVVPDKSNLQAPTVKKIKVN